MIPRSEPLIIEIQKEEIKAALDLVNRVFSEFVAVDYTEEGNNTFNDYLKIKYKEVVNDVQSGAKKIWGYYISEDIVGVIATRDISHIALMFVDKEHHGKGIARKLLGVVLEDVKTNPGIEQITVNSSPYAAIVYERLGFVKTGETQDNNGIVFIPMARRLQK